MSDKLYAMNVGSLVVGAFEVNCVILWDDARRAVVVDPGADAEDIERFLADHQLTLTAIWLTHGHIDHVSALTDLLKVHPVSTYIHKDEVERTFSPRNRIPPYWTVPEKPSNLVFLHDGDVLSVGNETMTVLHTPGHGAGCVCYYSATDKLLLTGDTLFRGGVGRTDFASGDMGALQSSLARLMTLPDDTRVIPGHGPQTTIQTEKISNPFLEH